MPTIHDKMNAMLTLKIAIIDDNDRDSDFLEESILRFVNAHKDEYAINIVKFNRGINFLEPFDDTYDAIFLDIDMPVISGMETAKRIRALGSQVNILFVTNYASLAIDGYGVGALDFVVKPVKDEDVARALTKLIEKINKESEEDKIVIKVKSGYRTVKIDSIKYIEVNTHDVYYYTTGETYRTRETLKDIEKNINSPKFVKCSSSYLINLDYVDAIDKDDVRIDGKRVKIARTRKKEFLAAFLDKYK